jgi:hypothetical protein
VDTLWRDKLKHKEINETIQNTVKDMTRGSIQEILEVEEEGKTISSLDDQASLRNKLFPNESLRDSSLCENPDEQQKSLLYSQQETESQKIKDFISKSSQIPVNSLDNLSNFEKWNFRKNKELLHLKSLDHDRNSRKKNALEGGYIETAKPYKTEKKNLVNEDLEKIKISFLSQEEKEEVGGNYTNTQSQNFELQRTKENEVKALKITAKSVISPKLKEPMYDTKENKEGSQKEPEIKMDIKPVLVDSNHYKSSEDFDLGEGDNFINTPSNQHDELENYKIEISASQEDDLFESILTENQLIVPENSKTSPKSQIQRSTDVPKKIKILEVPKIAISEESNKEHYFREEIGESIKSRTVENQDKIRYLLNNAPTESQGPRINMFNNNKFSNNIISVGTGSESNIPGLIQHDFQQEEELRFNDVLFSKSSSRRTENDLGLLKKSMLFSQDSVEKQETQDEKVDMNEFVELESQENKKNLSEGSNIKESVGSEVDSKFPNQNSPRDQIEFEELTKLNNLKNKAFHKNKMDRNPNFYSSFQTRNNKIKNYNLNSAVLFRRNSEVQKKVKNVNRVKFPKRIQKSLSPNNSKFLKELKKNKKTKIQLNSHFQDVQESKAKLAKYTRTLKNQENKTVGRIVNRGHTSHSYDLFAKDKKHKTMTESIQRHKKKNNKAFTLNYKLRSLYSNVFPDKKKKSKSKQKQHTQVNKKINEYNFTSENFRLTVSVDRKDKRHKSEQNNLFKTINYTPKDNPTSVQKGKSNFFEKMKKFKKEFSKQSPDASKLKNFQSAHNILKCDPLQHSNNFSALVSNSSKKVKNLKFPKHGIQSFVHETFKNVKKKKGNLMKEHQIVSTFKSFKKQLNKEGYESNKKKSKLIGSFKGKKNFSVMNNMP